MSSSSRRLVIGISGASGAIYGIRLLELLRALDIETHLVMSKSAQLTLIEHLGVQLYSQKHVGELEG